MSAPVTKRYRVMVLELNTYAVTIEVITKSSAEKKARALGDLGETDQFSTRRFRSNMSRLNSFE